jgi:phage terminase large subunit-like protein
MTLLEELTQYSNDCINGEVIACKKLKQACARFLRDIARQGADDFPYIFIEDGALRFLKWMRLFKHTKGWLAGTYKEPHISEKFEFGNIYGWARKDTGHRRFRYAYIQKARKNAKSQDLAMMGDYELAAFGEPCSEVYIAATKKDQCRYVYNEAVIIFKQCEQLKDKLITKDGMIQHPKSGSIFARLSKDDRKSGSGGNPQCFIIDEYHEHETAEYHDLGASGMKTRQQPILIIITTAGVNLNSPCYEEYKYCAKILDPDNPTENDRYFVCIYEMDKDDDGNIVDDINDEALWRKPNPIIYDDPVALENIRSELKTAKDRPEKMRDFLTKTMDVWINQRDQGYMPMDKWAACAATKDDPFPDVKELKVITGLDLAEKIDLCSMTHEIELPDGRIAVMQHSFLPQETYDRYVRQARTNYDIWKQMELLTVTPGGVVDYEYILDYIEATYEKYNWKKGEVAYDRALATWLTQQLEKRGYTPAEIPQGMYTLGAPTKDFRDEVYKKHVIHNDPMLSWAIGNAVCEEDRNKNVMLNKTKSSEKIDPAAALMNAHTRYVVQPKVSVYDTRPAGEKLLCF